MAIPKNPIDRPSPNRSDSREIVEAVLQAAVLLGPDASMNEIARRAGVGPASLHRHFDGKSAIFAEIARRCSEAMATIVRRICRRSAPVKASLAQMITELFDLPNASWEVRAELQGRVPPVLARDAHDRVTSEIVDSLTEWIRNVPSEVAPETRAFLAMSTVHGVIRSAMLYKSPPREDLLPELIDLVTSVLGLPQE